MTYHDHRSDLRTDRAREMGASARQARWSWVVAVALVIALGLAFYGIDASRNGPKTANPPAVTAAPAPATGVAPPAAPETTGRGAAPSERAR
jgi:hypothetical protein